MYVHDLHRLQWFLQMHQGEHYITASHTQLQESLLSSKCFRVRFTSV